MADLLPVPRGVERQFSREVNVTRFSKNEFREKLHHEDHFLKSIIKGRPITIMGSLNELEKLPAENKVHANRTSNKESDDLRAVICGILKMQAIQELSDDRRFATAYNAALQTAKMFMTCAGFRQRFF
jgi:hypothetical protein